MEQHSAIEREASSDGLSYLTCGPPGSSIGLMCVHGWGYRAEDFKNLLREVSWRNVSYRAVAVDLPGHGHTPKDVCPQPSIAAFATAVLALCNGLHLSKVVLAGHGLGCRVVLEAARQAPAAGTPIVRGLVFLDGSHFKLRPGLLASDDNDPRSQNLTAEQKAEAKRDAFQQMFSQRAPQFPGATLAHIESPDTAYDGALRRSHIDYDFNEMDDAIAAFGKSGIAFINLQSTDVDAPNRRKRIKWAQMSPWMSFLRDNIPHAKQYIIEYCAHFPHRNRPDLVAAILIVRLESILS